MELNDELKELGPVNASGSKARRRSRTRRSSPRNSFTELSDLNNRQHRNIPVYSLLSEDQLCAIEIQADWIAREIGFEFRGQTEALALFEEAGASVDGERVRFDPGHLRQLCSSAPASYEMHGRDGTKNFTLGGDHVVLMPGYGSPFVTDLDNGRRYASLKDFQKLIQSN